jgi:DNA-binding HxlR family transcriptional regulator|tara:strand:+ start:2787 stop:3218 length:432 start_codon:yes stop_codon:yes gene_type:complete
MFAMTPTALDEPPSTCPIHASLLVLGDRWSLLVVRDLMFAGYRSFNQFQKAGEGIATNVLTDRLLKLTEAGIITRRQDPDDGRKWLYGLTPKGIDLAPVLVELSKWGTQHERGTPPDGVLESWDNDSEGFLADLRNRLMRDGA